MNFNRDLDEFPQVLFPLIQAIFVEEEIMLLSCRFHKFSSIALGMTVLGFMLQ